MKNLFQTNPKKKSTFIPRGRNGKQVRDYSFTNSLESYDNASEKEAKIVHWNKRMPTATVVWHLLKAIPPTVINDFRQYVFRYLQRYGIEALVSIELTRGEDRKPNNRVHFHFLLDDPRSKKEITELFNKACRCSGIAKQNFRIDYKELHSPKNYIKYFTKTGKHKKKVILFEKNTGLQKHYVIGKWFKKTRAGQVVKKGKREIWQEIIAYMRNKQYAKSLFD